MSTRPFQISALSPILEYAPQRPDAPGSPWKSDSGSMVNSNANTGNPGRYLQGTGTVTVQGFGTGFSIAGSLQGVYCSYTAVLSAGAGNKHDTSSISPQTAPPATGMLAQFTGLENDNWVLKLRGDCSNGSFLKITQAVIDGWVGGDGGTVSNNTLDDQSNQLRYSDVDWGQTKGLAAPFYGDSQHYTGVSGATMNLTFSGTAIVVWSSVDNQHGPYSVALRKASDPYTDDGVAVRTGFNPFLAVPVPFFFASGLNPSQQYTLTLKNRATNGTYLDLDYISIYTSTGGGPPNGGFSGLLAPAPKKNNLPIIIGAVVGGVALLLLLLVLIWFIRKRRTTRVQRNQGTRPLDDQKGSSNDHVIPLQTHGNVTPYRTPGSPFTHESQALLQGSPQQGSIPMSSTMSTTTGGYDPYAAFGGGYPTPHSSSVHGSSIIDPVQARRQGKAAEIEAARERMRHGNNGSTGMLSPTTPNPATSTTNSTFGPSWETSSHGQSSSDPSSMPATHIPHRTPDDPPPSYYQT
ncbi:SubName: Full=Uncharacterized protein {ECO:0000313/EMBL:CCA75970.1} [Serendipita indica DSM 11827]|uniref:Uncharacterized protein n=1 Tax=Serendipita indica (strain DSM 11827) TaxID=1109443 RepID=G4TXC7_SERID|nr:SubName: Full=Uncharacterized protein {ECO:0000313/EMBL:CCA75970.1} [Serendipita indica DSM 11827]CCA75970.1 hypothetical protein PIIN_09966 [Serendipita indica DSM 11827]